MVSLSVSCSSLGGVGATSCVQCVTCFNSVLLFVAGGGSAWFDAVDLLAGRNMKDHRGENLELINCEAVQ